MKIILIKDVKFHSNLDKKIILRAGKTFENVKYYGKNLMLIFEYDVVFLEDNEWDVATYEEIILSEHLVVKAYDGESIEFDITNKETPTKPLNFVDYGTDKYGVCPRCKIQKDMDRLTNNDNYCPNCGQALDWN